MQHDEHRKLLIVGFILGGLLAAGAVSLSAQSLRSGARVVRPPVTGDNHVEYRCLSSLLGLEPGNPPALERSSRFGLPSTAAAVAFDTTINVLVLRMNFQLEVIDDPNTTGRGQMALANPLFTPADSIAYYDSVGHWIDPPPHDSRYFNAQMKALRGYYEQVSEGKITLDWQIFPRRQDSAYLLPNPMNFYGRCDFDEVIDGLVRFFIDAIRTADADTAIHFADYDAIVIFHAGSDRQNDIGFPETCNDLFTGWIRYGGETVIGPGDIIVDSIPVDDSTAYVSQAVMMPETACQDNRATALNAVMAHEFGHQLGLVDLYDTRTFMSQLGDFSLMDNNGFGTGIDFGFSVGQVFGAIPIYPDAWSRAFLGLTPAVDFRRGSDLRIVAAEVLSSGIKIARIPISENEYYLLENRLVDTDNEPTFALLDSTNVILGPVNASKEFTGEYDYLLPGSGLLVFHVDEGVAGLDYNGDGEPNFNQNQLQWDAQRRFVRLVEADGFVNFGGYYRAGFGRPEDMFRDDRATAFTPNTNPPSIDNSGNNTRVYVTDIRRDTITLAGQRVPTVMDSVIRFDLEIDGLVDSFPVRAGYPRFGLSTVAADIDRDGVDEIIVSSGKILSVITADGENFLRKVTNCAICPTFFDTAFASTHPGTLHPLALYDYPLDTILSGPVTGDFGAPGPYDTQLVAVGFASGPANGRVALYAARDASQNGRADLARPSAILGGQPVALSFGDLLYALTFQSVVGVDTGRVYRKPDLLTDFTNVLTVYDSLYHGICRLGNRLIVMAGDENTTRLYHVGFGPDSVSSIQLDAPYNFGPMAVDMNRDGLPEVVGFTPEGRAIYVTVDTNATPPVFSILRRAETGATVTANPVAGDIDLDGWADVIVGGAGQLYAYDQNLILKTDFPVHINDRYPTDPVIAAPIIGDAEAGSAPEILFPTDVGNIYAFGAATGRSLPGYTLAGGFPLSGGEKGAGSPVILRTANGARLGYLGADGWFYLWDIDHDPARLFWPMGGHDPHGTFALPTSALGEPVTAASKFKNEQFYNYPNPVTNGATIFRYTLGASARRVTIAVYDLSGERILEFAGSTNVGDNSVDWNCGDITPGVYRCRIEAEFDTETTHGFTDVAIIR